MADTQRLYETDAYCFAFEAQVLQCEKDDRGWFAVLDRTAFFPEGGGQPGDTGTLGGVNVTDTRIKGGVILHRLAGPLQAGTTVQGQVNAARRLDFMQQHTGEHMLSGILHNLYGCDNVGFGISSDNVRLDTNLELTAEQLAVAEARANEVVRQNVPVKVLTPTPEELAAMTYRSKKELEGQVRIVEIPGADVCACCGTHVAASGEVGIIKILTAEKYKGGTRLQLACGERAYRQYAAEHDALTRISGLTSAKLLATADAVARLQDELAAQKLRAARAEACWFEALAQGAQPGQRTVLQLPDLSGDSLRRLCLALAERAGTLCAVFTPGGSGMSYAMCGLADMRPVGKALNAAFQGRGGGKPELVQGSVAETNFEKLKAFLLQVQA